MIDNTQPSAHANADDHAWIDPWLESRLRRDDERAARVADGALTRRGCAWTGARIYAAGTVLSMSACAACAMLGERTKPLHLDMLLTLSALLFALVPPAAALGAAYGSSLFTQANVEPIPRRVGCWVWLVLFLLARLFALPLYFSYHHRRAALDYGYTSWLMPAMYTALTVLAATAAAFDRVTELQPLLVVSALLAWGACDGLLVNRIVRLNNAGMLAPPYTQRFQFSLGTLLLCVWGIGAWITGLVVLARSMK